ncbi:HAMP domain-containing protein [Sulfitobacter sp. BDSS02]|jgi:signal transduction histidine kinase|uniref:histidine kinase n=2 Tax=Roseovarius mucosus TaxID=215743 RepID=A0A1V0RUY2_9RHOB|nr:MULTISPECIES: ATP-binding protein [Alphaproteobacteria]MAN98947.1 two-component sensor histidine kinase [Roseovarius sp.]MBL3705403.1 HAMP domain-containing protein [Sulfitobacter sp. BDSS02]MBR9851436.1 HAMP domain-containing protein [Paracoccaceae bacterium]PKQ11491.1 MAG: two-component sensor histidine kinase [Alphaproteobacteria bacterium HGW-Alphaproteobacteria-1]ARE85601.1 osmolarity sensor protein EnvZ [Roseovarius mucosus]|tara:strand:- start:12473 stop:13882 length:1410 start_codon:yes stop_codon:yes gene_type:complete
MPRPFDNLRGQLVLLIVAALAVAQTISLWLFVDERGLAVRAALGFEAAGRAANVALLLEEAPESLQQAILRAANSPLVRFDLSDIPAVDHESHADGGAVEARVRGLLGGANDREIRVELHEVEQGIPPMPHLAPEMAEMHLAMMRGELSAIEMQLSIALADGQWLNVGTRFERPPLQWPWASIVSFGITAAIILVSACWFLLTRLTGPLLRVSRAADRLGKGEAVDPLPLIGPSEVRGLTQAFNRMQARLTRFVADRTRLLAALGHDLRSPLTAMRVRAEMVDEDETRESLVASIEEMQEMVDATLAFARGMASSEVYETVDLKTYLKQLQADMIDGFTLDTANSISVRLRPQSVRRALRNIIENAQRYGGGAEVTFVHDAEYVQIRVSDNGPGVPEAELEQVFEPFFRLEKSRSRETGGTGLGLSIARTIVRAHGGDVALTNRTEGGLLVTVTLPLETEPDQQERNTS